MPRLFQFPQVVQSNQLYLHCYQTILPAPDCSGLSPMSLVVSMNPKLFRVLLGYSILFLIVTERSAPVPTARVRTKFPLVSSAFHDLPKGVPPPHRSRKGEGGRKRCKKRLTALATLDATKQNGLQ